jgi:hypothetical protein
MNEKEGAIKVANTQEETHSCTYFLTLARMVVKNLKREALDPTARCVLPIYLAVNAIAYKK